MTRNSVSVTMPKLLMNRCDRPNQPVDVVQVPDRRGDQHRADVGRQRHAERREALAHPESDPHRDEYRDEILDDRPGVVVVSRGDYGRREFRLDERDIDVAAAAAAAARRRELAALDEDRAGRPADQAAGDDAADRDRDGYRGRADDARFLE